MTHLDDRLETEGSRSGLGRPLWRPFAQEPVLTPAMALGWEATAPADQERLARYLSALVAARRGPVHVNVAFNAAYFGYDLTDGGYVGGPLDLAAFPQVHFGQTTDALPVGAMVNIAAGEQPLFAEVVYKEGAHPALSDDGAVPAWLSGAPAGATGPGAADAAPGGPVLTERLVADVDAFGQDFSTTSTRLQRLRQRGQWLDAAGHLLLDARYATRRDADLDESSFYAQYLLTRGRDQLLSAAAPLPLSTVLSDDAGEDQLAAALTGMFGTIADALASLPELRMWHGYAFTRASLAARLSDPGPLGGNDLSSLATGLARAAVPLRPGRWAPQRTITYTAVGPRLRTVRDATAGLIDVGYAVAVCHANAVIGDYARRETDENTGLLPDDVHLRLDDSWQGGGVWRAERPGSIYSDVDVLEPLGLGWAATMPDAAPSAESQQRPGPGPESAEQQAPADEAPEAETEPEPESEPEVLQEPELAPLAEPGPLPEPEGDDPDELTVTDSQISWTHAMRLTHLLDGRLPLPDIIGTQMRDAGLAGIRLRLMLTHDGFGLDPAEETQAVAADLFGSPQLSGVEWPIDFFPGIVLTCTWGRGAGVVRATTTLLECPVTVDGRVIEHRYDPRILTRDDAPGQPRRGGAPGTGTATGTLSLAQRILRSVRRMGLLDPDGRAVLARAHLPAAVYGATDGASAAELDVAVDELLTADRLRLDVGSVDPRRRLRYPAEPGASTVPVVVYEPRPVAGPPRAVAARQPAGALDVRFLRTHAVAGHLRRIGDLGWEAGDEARAAYREDRIRFGLIGPADLPDGYTYVRPFSRGGS